MQNKKIYIVIPAYNESGIIQNVIQEINAAGYRNLIIIDDGSADDTHNKVKNISNVIALKLKLNCGKGGATKTGIEAAKLLKADIVITMDGDGQHDPNDIERLIKPILNEECDIVLGSRLFNPEGMPKIKVLANHIGNFCTWIFFGLWVNDSQSGFRAYSQKAIHLIDTKGNRYEYDSEVIREIKKHKLKFTEVPIKVRYTDYSMNKLHKQGFINGIKTIYKMLWNIIS